MQPLRSATARSSISWLALRNFRAETLAKSNGVYAENRKWVSVPPLSASVTPLLPLVGMAESAITCPGSAGIRERARSIAVPPSSNRRVASGMTEGAAFLPSATLATSRAYDTGEQIGITIALTAAASAKH
jgi:hypothetical protein